MSATPPSDFAAAGLIRLLSDQACEAAGGAVFEVARHAPAPLMPSILLNAGLSVIAQGAQIMAAINAKDASLTDKGSPIAGEIVRAYGRAMQAYPDIDAMNAIFTREVKRTLKGVTAVDVSREGR